MKTRNILILTTVLLFCVLLYGVFSIYETEKITERDIEVRDVSEEKQEIREGDIIFQTSTSSQSQAIQLATDSKYSHMGIIFENNGELLVYEAIQPVQFTPLDKWIKRGKDNHYVVKRLKDAEQLLTNDVLVKMKQVGKEFEGKRYDIYFGWSDEAIYCSELVWKIYNEVLGVEIGQLEKLSDFDLSHDEVRQKMKERYGNNIPDTEQFISPAAMFNSDKLMDVEFRN